MRPRLYHLTAPVLEGVVASIRGGASIRDAFESCGIPHHTGRHWLKAGELPGSEYAELAERVAVARAQSRVEGMRERSAMVVAAPLPEDGDSLTGLDLLAARVPSARASLTSRLDGPAAAERAVQASMAALEMQADILARQDEITSSDLKDLRAAIRDAGKLHEQLAGAEKNRAQARASQTVEMFVVAMVAVVGRQVTPDQLMRIRGDLERLPAVAGVFADDQIVDVTPALVEPEPVAVERET